jgi:membrane protease YdiL (CAAX protease family)
MNVEPLSREFLLQRGFCCGNGCQNCPYNGDMKKNTPSEKLNFSVFDLKKVGFLTPDLQIFSIALMFFILSAWNYLNFLQTGTLFGYPVSVSLFFAPIYEEILFRGFIFVGLQRIYSLKKSAVITCLLFSLWHFKNIFWLTQPQLIHQMIYSGFVIGPIFLYLTWRTKSIWPGVMLHYANNILALAMYPLTNALLLFFFGNMLK